MKQFHEIINLKTVRLQAIFQLRD